MEVRIVPYIVVGLVATILIIFKYLINKYNSGISLPSLPFPMTLERRAILEKYFIYYQKLTARDKKRFADRISLFIQSKTFIPRGIQKVTDEMKIHIAASAIQLTFGLPGIYLRHFKYILIYPDHYYSIINRQYHKGEVNPRHRAIVLSWKAYVEGYAKNEGINLGLHEMAHALHLENAIRNPEFDFLPAEELAQWDQECVNEMKNLEKGQEALFRSYGTIDSFEFFAVAVEMFFERPKAFADHNLALYNCLVKLLNQNPLKMFA